MTLTLGEFRVRARHDDPDLAAQIKRGGAYLIDLLEELPHSSPEVIRLKALAQTAIETGVMWGVKAAIPVQEKPDEPT